MPVPVLCCFCNLTRGKLHKGFSIIHHHPATNVLLFLPPNYIYIDEIHLCSVLCSVMRAMETGKQADLTLRGAHMAGQYFMQYTFDTFWWCDPRSTSFMCTNVLRIWKLTAEKYNKLCLYLNSICQRNANFWSIWHCTFSSLFFLWVERCIQTQVPQNGLQWKFIGYIKYVVICNL